MFTRSSAVAIVSGLVLTASAQSAVLFSETFESYSSGNLQGQGGWVDGTGGGRWDVQTTGDANAGLRPATYTGSDFTIDAGARAAVLASQDDRDINTSVGAQTGTLYLSALARHVSTGSGSNFGAPLHVFASNRQQIQFGLRGTGSNSTTNVRGYASLNGNSSTAGQFVESANIPVANTHLLIVRLSKSGSNGANYDTIDLWVDPTSSTQSFTPGTNGYVGSTTFNGGASSLNGVGLYGDNRTPHGGFDNITIGEAWSDIIPEPSTLSAVTLCGLPLLRRRRRA